MRLVVRDEFAQRDRYMRDNLDAMAQKLGEMQAKMVKLEAMGDRVSGLAGLKPDELRAVKLGSTPVEVKALGGSGGPFVAVSLSQVHTPEDFSRLLSALDDEANRHNDVLTLIESRLFEKRLTALMIPSSVPVQGPIGSGFGFRADPFTGQTALHTGLDFPADVGTPVMAAAGGVVIAAQEHPQYGQMIELDHGNGLVTRYGHASKLLVHQGDLVKRGQRIANVGTTGRSTGPHLHFEVLVEGVQQDPEKFLAGSGYKPTRQALAQVKPLSRLIPSHPSATRSLAPPQAATTPLAMVGAPAAAPLANLNSPSASLVPAPVATPSTGAVSTSPGVVGSPLAP
jgi:murein DD-endopeptidase MepM/ murein hydrolase activator NlpD